MSLLDRARRDWKAHITSESGAGVGLFFSTPGGSNTAEVRGLGMSHHLSFDTDGQVENSRNSHVTVYEQDLIDAGYPVRVNNEVKMFKHLITFRGSEGIDRTFIIKQCFPDETVGVITFILALTE